MKPVSPSAASRAAAMEDEERRRKLEAGRAKLAEYRQRKAQSDGQKKQKKKKQKGSEPEDSGVQQEGAGERKETPTTEFSFSRTLRSGETVKHDQTYTIEPESEVSTTAEDCSSEVNGCHVLSQRSLKDEELHPPMSPLEEELQQAEPPSRLQAMEDELAAKNLTVEELSRELEEIRAAFGAEGVQQLQDFEAALKQRDGIITQLTANLQQARTEKDEVMREFLELTEQSQKLQLQFQQLQVGESLRSSSISSTAADLIQARQQVLFFQQQLEDRGVKVKDLQVQLEERDIEVIGLQEKLLQMTQRLSQIETVSREAEESFTRRLQEKDLRVAEQEKLLAELQDGVRASEQRLQQVAWEAEESFAQRLQEKDLQRVEQERLIAEQQQLLAQLQDNLQASKNHLNEVSEQLAMKVRELEACELDLQTSRQKERLSSGEIQQLMGTVEDLQKRYHHQGAEQGDTARKMDYLRAELDEMYGQQIVQMKQELSARHAEELARIRDQHSAEVDKISEHLRAKWTQSAGEVNALNARVVELQQKLQENQVLREKAEQDLAQVSENKLLLQNQVQELVENLRLAKQCNEMERSQTVQQELQAAISDLQAKLVAAHEASSELEAKHESEITNYQIKLEMLEREKDAVLDRMAESQEAELERLRTQLLFSHEEELFRLREDLQHESQMNMENLRDELRQVRNGYEAEKVVLDAERVSLLQEIVVLKHDLSQALENSRVDELVSQLKELQEEVQELRKRDSEKSEPEVEETWKDNLESENKLLKEKETAMVEELKSLKEDHEVLLKKMGTLATDNEKANKLVEELRAEIEKQKTTFSFAEKNFEINCQELREELEERLRELTLQYETKLQKLQTKLQTPEQGHEKGWTEEREEKETDGAALVEKDVTELMEKLQRVELEKAGLEEKVEQKQTELQKMEGELQWVELEKVELLEQKEAHLRRIEVEKVELVEQFKQKEEELCALRDEVRETALKNNGLERELEALKWMQLEDGGVCSIKDHHLQLTALEEELQALRTLRSVEQDRLAVLQQEEQALLEQREEEEVEAVPVEGLLAPPLALTGRESQSTMFTKQRTHSRNGGSGGVVVTETQQKQVKIRDVLSDGETGVQAVTRPLSMEGSDHEECRLQMEALRISLSQIHAAQLELLKESLNTQTTVPKDDPRCRSFNEGQSEDYKRLAQMAREDQTVRSDGVPSSGPAGPPLGQLNEEAIDRSSGWEVDRRLRLEFHEQQELQEQQHRQEIQRLRSYYSQQAEETEERYRNEINLLQSRLQELTGAEAIYSVPGDSPHLHQRADLLQDAQLDELDSSRTERDERPGDPEDLQRQREEDIAKVIVQMSVEFAQQTELARISRQAGDGEREKLEEELLQLRNQLEMLEAHHSTCTQQDVQTEEKEQIKQTIYRGEDEAGDEERDHEEHGEQHSDEDDEYKVVGEEQVFVTEELQYSDVLQREDSGDEGRERLEDETISRYLHYGSFTAGDSDDYIIRGERGNTKASEDHREGLREDSAEGHREDSGKGHEEESGGDHREDPRGHRKDSGESHRKDPRDPREDLRYHREDSSEGSGEGHEEESGGDHREDPRGHRKDSGEGHRKDLRDPREDSSEGHSEDSRGHRDDSGKGHGEDSGGDHGERSGEAAVLCPLLDDDGDEYVGGVAEAQALLAQLQYELALQAEEHSEVLEELRSSHALQLERHRDQLTQLTTQIQTLSTQLEQQGAEQTDREEEKESGGEEIRRPSMQSSGTQTEARSGEEDEEGERMRKKEDVMSQLSSQDTESSPDFITSERNLLRKANEKLRQVLVDVLKTTAATEETIGRHVETLLEASSRGQQPVHREASSESFHGSETVLDDASVFSAETETDEGLEMSQMLLGAGLHLERVDLQSDGAEPQMEREEYLSSISSRLQSAVEKLLFTITETTSQLEHARVTQTELMREKFRHSEEIAELLRRQEELQERLQEEASARQRLALQLHNAEGLIDGYSGERRALEEQVRERAELQLQLEQELQVTSSRLHELEDERQNLHHQRELLHRQQEAMRGGAGGRELHLLEETEKLMQEKVEVQRQAEKEHAELLQQVKQLEAELEEQVGHFAELEDAHRAESADLTQQIHALEKQLENNRRFLDEQAVDREHERDVFQQEIQKLEQQLKNPPKPLPSSDQHHREVEELSSALREKADWCSELLLRSEQLQREVEERDEEIEKLESRVRALEQALTANADTLSTAEESKQYASMAAGDDATLEALLQTEREALDRKEKEIVNLEEQLEQFREELQNKSEEVQQLHMQLEIQRKEINTQQQELLAQTDLHAVLEQKDREIALLNEHIAKVQLAETSPDNKEVEEKSELVLELEAQVEYLRGEQERLKRDGEEEVEQLNSVIEKLQQELSHIEHKQSPAESVPEEEEYDELKQKMDQVVRELDTLKTDHSSLLGKYESLRQEALERELETEKQGERLEDALRERTAALVVAQAQVQALEESAGSRVSDLTQRIAELEESVEEKELELHACRLQVGRAQDDAESLHLKVSQLEDKLREKVAAMLVSQAQLEAVQVQTKELHRDEAVLDDAIAGLVHSRAGAELWPSPGLAVAPVQKVERVGKVGFLTEKLQELELGLSFMQKDQELQKELLSSSEEEVQEYERRLAVLMELLNQMRTRPPHTPAQAMGDDSAAMEELLQELQEVKGEAAATKEELDSCRVLSQKLQEQIELKEAAIEELEKDLQKASEQGSEEDSSKVSELLQELQEVKGEAAATKEELSSCKDISQKLQEQIQEREMTIALLKDQLHRASGEVDNSEILQELQEVRSEAAATKEELNSYIERSLKLQEQIQVRDVSIAQLMDELQQLRTALSKASEDAPAQQPQSHSRKKAGKHSEGKGKGSSVAKDKPSLSRKNSNSQPEKSANGSQASCQTRVDAGTQVEQVEVSEELEEVIGEYRERIGQMQELHAAEIMDMENRHISESDSLKRENQRLEQECSALRAAVANLRSGEAARQDLPASSQFRDGYASDSSSDWSQRTGFELPHLQAEFRSTPEGARRDDSEVLPDRIKTLLREVHQEGMQVLSLSEIPVPEAEHPAAQLPLQAWRKEKEALLDTVESLKTLVTQLQTHSQTQTDTESAGDWRADLLSAVQQVFLREREVLKVTLLTQLDLLDTRDAVIHLNQLERALTDQDAVQREVLSSLQSADRRSLLAEISDLRTRLQHLQQDAHLSQQPRPVDSSGMSEDWPEAGGEVEGGGSDGRREGGSDGGGGGEREDRLPAAVEDLKGELAQTKLELEVSLQTQSKYLKELETLRAEVCGKASELDSLSDRLAEEQKRVRELQWAMEREKNRATRREEGEREELEDLRLALEDQQARVADLSVSLEEERKVSTQLREERDGEISEHISLNTELQVQLEAQRLQAVELSSSLQKEKELNAQLLRQLQRSNPDTQRPPQAVSAQGVELAEASCSQVEEGVRSVEVLLQSLQDQLTEKQSALVDLMGQLEQQKLQEVQAKRAWEQDRAELTRDLQGARESLAKLERQAEELKAQLDGERERGLRLERERDGLQQRVTELMERSQRDSQQQTPWRAEGQPVDRTRDWVLQQKEEEARTLTSSSTTMLDAAGQTADSRNLDSVITRLQLIASKINGMTSNTAGRLPAEGPDRESLAWLHSNVQDVLSLLQQVPPVPPPVPESAALLTGGSSSALTERLLRQNAELTGFVSRLTEEKNELRNQLLSLEEELRRQRHLLAHSSSRSGSEGQELVLFSSEREAWSREKMRLEKSLRQAEAELSRLRGEIRSNTLRDVAAPDTDNSALKRIYGKYLRAESFRKALIYQKKYLLLLLGGFQECEEATLSLIARMGGRPTYSHLESLGQHRRGFTRFRSAVRVSIALSRMRFLVRRWKKATGGSLSTPSINRNGLGQFPGIEGRNDSPYLQPSVEQYGERRGTNRTGRESPRTGHYSHHRYGAVGGDGGSVLCSHLQNYDPDRALTDYISRLEALQRRLGSVQSGSSSYAQLHFGVRR
ncbi:A-kinase anchor protein 9 isoform X5 [Pygocentrus nattereri]|uniref:A-kinase anchor protein 9 isoform X5 n=1 Tax=Pygocentrus nattereri TaxID=42514 RepID=UPI0018916E01|nr:A-kinase anchor protein 9 isoform X5 [Pygocentrus nattereri]